MAERLMKYYQYIGQLQGANGRTHLAMKTKVPSVLAANRPDTPELLELFQRVCEELTGLAAPKY